VALTTPGEVRRLGGLDDELAYELFRLPDEAALDALISDEIDLASAYLTSKAGSDYTQTADSGKQAIFRRAEAYFVLMQLAEPLKARKVYGKHAPYASEESLSYQRLIDEEWAAKFEMLVGQFIADDTGSPYSAGVFITTEPFDRLLDVDDDVPTRNADILAEANGWAPWPLP